MGYVNDFDIIVAIAALEKGLYEAGYPVELGKGLSTAQSSLVGKNSSDKYNIHRKTNPKEHFR